MHLLPSLVRTQQTRWPLFGALIALALGALLATQIAQAQTDAVTISASDASVSEGDSGETDLNFTVTLSGSPNAQVEIRATAWAKGAANPAKGGRGAGRDFLGFKNQNIVFAANATGDALTKTVTVTVVGDQVDEDDETFILLLNNIRTTDSRVVFSSGAPKLEVTGTITDDDDETDISHEISVSDASVIEGDSRKTAMNFTVTLSGSPSHTVTVNAADASGTASAGEDYILYHANRTIVFAANATGDELRKTVPVYVLGDRVAEGDETFTLRLTWLGSDDHRVMFEGGRRPVVTGTIVDDDEGEPGENEPGENEASAPPAAPTGLNAEPESHPALGLRPHAPGMRVTLTWTAPPGSVTGYEYQYRSTSDANWGAWTLIPNSAARTEHPMHLDAGSYEFRLRAVNAAGAGAESAVVSATLLPRVPTAPNLTVTAGPGQAQLSWDASVGRSITGYQVSYIRNYESLFPAQWTSIGDTTTYTFKPLDAGVPYEFFVRAVNDFVNGDEATVYAIPSAAAPSVTATAGPNRVKLSWAALAGKITEYQIRYKRASDAEWGNWSSVGSATTHTVELLESGSEYQFVVRAQSAGGDGAESTVASATPTAPAAPSVTATAGPNRMKLSWTAPADWIMEYQLRYKRASDIEWGGWTSVGSATTHTVESLEGDVEYQFIVRAQSIGDNGTESAMVSAAPTRPVTLRCVIRVSDPMRCIRLLENTAGDRGWLVAEFVSGKRTILPDRNPWYIGFYNGYFGVYGWEVRIHPRLDDWSSNDRNTGTALLRFTYTATDGTVRVYMMEIEARAHWFGLD